MNDERDLLQRLKEPATRREAFGQVVGLYSKSLYLQIRHMVQWHEDADDVLQNTFMKAWTALDDFRGESKLSTWLYRIAYNECLSFLERRRDFQPIDDGEDGGVLRALESDPYFDGDETMLMLQKALATLPEKQRAVFNLKYFEEMKYEEMSALLGTSVGALKASYHIAVKKIEDYFKAQD